MISTSRRTFCLFVPQKGIEVYSLLINKGLRSVLNLANNRGLEYERRKEPLWQIP